MKAEGPISLTVAARRAGKTPETIANWCRRYGIGKQMGPKMPWRVDPEALACVIEGDAERLAGHLAQKDGAR